MWASWHFPYLQALWAHTEEGLVTLLPRFLLGTFVLAVLYGEIRIRTGSVWPAVLMHWSGNALANTLLVGSTTAGFITFATGKAWLGSFGAEGAFMILIAAIVGGTLYWQRRGQAEFTINGSHQYDLR